MTNHKKPKGWVKEPARHGLAAKGVKTATVRGVTYREDSGVMMEPLLKAQEQERHERIVRLMARSVRLRDIINALDKDKGARRQDIDKSYFPPSWRLGK